MKLTLTFLLYVLIMTIFEAISGHTDYSMKLYVLTLTTL